MNTIPPQASYTVFSQLQNNLRQVKDLLRNPSKMKNERVVELKILKEKRGELLYHDRANMQYDNSISLFKEEIHNNRRYYRSHKDALQDYKEELVSYQKESFPSLLKLVQIELETNEADVAETNSWDPTRATIYNEQGEDITFEKDTPESIERYQIKRDNWFKETCEHTDYQYELLGLKSDIKAIHDLIDQFVIPSVKKNQKPSSKQPDDAVIESFPELFKVESDLEFCLGVLRKVTKNKSVIDDAGNWIGRRGSTSILIAWYEVLKERGKFKQLKDDNQRAIILNNYFPNLKLKTDEHSLWRKLTETRNDYRAYFLSLIPKQEFPQFP